jgi:hypothetical protein
MLVTVSIRQLKPNPFRRLDEYPIVREKVDALKESITQTGFWGTIVGRPAGRDVEIAFGHHRMIALRESLGLDAEVEVIVRDLTNDQMLQMMARENMEEWGTSFWAEVETVRATVEAFGAGLIDGVPGVTSKTRHNAIRYVEHEGVPHAYTVLAIARFLGWTRDKGKDEQPDDACKTAFLALDALALGLIEPAALRGLNRAQAEILLREQQKIRDSQLRAAAFEAAAAARARRLAAEAADERERWRRQKQAEVHDRQAAAHTAAATEKAAGFAPAAAEMLRAQQGRQAVKAAADELKAVTDRPPKVYQPDDFARRVAERFDAFASGGDELSGEFKFLKRIISDVSPRAVKEVTRAITNLDARLAPMRRVLVTSPDRPPAPPAAGAGSAGTSPPGRRSGRPGPGFRLPRL